MDKLCRKHCTDGRSHAPNIQRPRVHQLFLERLKRFLGLASLPCEWTMSVSAFLDESGKFKDHAVVSLSAIISPTSYFDAFGKEWKNCLGFAGLDGLSARKVLNAKRPLSKTLPALGTKARTDALLPFIACVRKHVQAVTGITIDVAAFNKLPSHYRQIWGNDPFFTSFARTVAEVLRITAKGEKISLICDDEEQTALPMYHLYRRYKKIDADARKKLGAISFADDRFLYGLQAADFVASIVRLEANQRFFGAAYDYPELFQAITKSSIANGEGVRLVAFAFGDTKMLKQMSDRWKSYLASVNQALGL
jgi:hypothetical protein